MAWILAVVTACLAMLGCALLFFRAVGRADQRLAEAQRARRPGRSPAGQPGQRLRRAAKPNRSPSQLENTFITACMYHARGLAVPLRLRAQPAIGVQDPDIFLPRTRLFPASLSARGQA